MSYISEEMTVLGMGKIRVVKTGWFQKNNLLRLLLVASLLVGWSNVGHSSSVPVVVEQVTMQPIYRSVQVTGTVTSPQVALLSLDTSGRVVSVYADEGKQVSSGDILLELDEELAELQWQSARAKSEQVRVALRDAQRRLREARILISQKSVAETAVRDLESEVAEDQALLEQAIAESRFRQALLARHTLRAPFAGVVSKKLTEQGEWVEPGDGAFELVATDNLRLDFPVAEDYLTRITANTEVTFQLNADPGQVYQGRVGTLVPITDPGARTFLLRVLVDEDNSTIIPGMSVQARLQVPTGRTGLVVPRDAILRYPDGRVVVWTIEKNSENYIVNENLVRIGETFDGHVEIREGLTPGIQVVVEGNESLRSGQPVFIASP